LLATGLSRGQIRWQSRRGGTLERLHRGIYQTGPPLLLDAIKAALLVSPPGSVVGYQTAALLHGFGVFRFRKEIHIVVPAGNAIPQLSGIIAHSTVVAMDDTVILFEIPCTSPARTAVDLARALPRLEALPVLDAALFSGACDRDDLIAELKRHARLRGIS